MFVLSLQRLMQGEKKGTIYIIGRSGYLEYVPVVWFPFCAVYTAQRCRRCNKRERWTWQCFGWEPEERKNRTFGFFPPYFQWPLLISSPRKLYSLQLVDAVEQVSRFQCFTECDLTCKKWCCIFRATANEWRLNQCWQPSEAFFTAAFVPNCHVQLLQSRYKATCSLCLKLFKNIAHI